MKKILFGLAALSAMAFGASTGVHNSTYGNNQIDVETKAFIINSGLVITASAGNTSAAIEDAIKKAVLDHGTLMAGTTANSTVARTVYVRKTNGENFPAGTVLNIALNHAETTEGLKNKLKTGTADPVATNTIAHTLTALVNTTAATFNAGSNTTSPATNNILTLTGATTNHNAEFVVNNTNNIPITLTSVINPNESNLTTNHVEGQYTNTSTLAVRFSKIPGADGSTQGTPAADYTNADGTLTPGIVNNTSTANQTAGIKADGKPGASALARR